MHTWKLKDIIFTTAPRHCGNRFLTLFLSQFEDVCVYRDLYWYEVFGLPLEAYNTPFMEKFKGDKPVKYDEILEHLSNFRKGNFKYYRLHADLVREPILKLLLNHPEFKIFTAIRNPYLTLRSFILRDERQHIHRVINEYRLLMRLIDEFKGKLAIIVLDRANNWQEMFDMMELKPKKEEMDTIIENFDNTQFLHEKHIGPLPYEMDRELTNEEINFMKNLINESDILSDLSKLGYEYNYPWQGVQTTKRYEDSPDNSLVR